MYELGVGGVRVELEAIGFVALFRLKGALVSLQVHETPEVAPRGIQLWEARGVP